MANIENINFEELPVEFKLTGFASNRAVYLNGTLLDLNKSLAVISHSPTGFNWGYSGSGPAQLALAIMLELVPEAEAVELYQILKHDLISALNGDSFNILFKFKEYMLRIKNKEQSSGNRIAGTITELPYEGDVLPAHKGSSRQLY